MSAASEMSAVKLALLAQQLRQQTDDAEVFAAEPIAIIGMGCRFPGADSPAAFWDLLRDGGDAIREIPADRWDVDAFYDADPYRPGTMNTRWGGFLDGIDQFDAHYFGLSPREAARMDPQQRVVMEVAVEALERAGQPASRLAGSLTGVFVAATMADYSDRQLAALDEIDAYSVTGNVHCIIANRLSFALDLRGPSLALDTACSSSLVAVHMACQSLRNRESDMALAGGVNVVLSPEPTIAMAKWGVMAADGRCKTFDARADGFVRGEGCGVVVLKRLADAVADGDPIAAVIRGSAVNQDGRSAAMSAPNGLAQQDVVRRALRCGRVRPERIACIEAHGTGTALGDPIEVEALSEVLGAPAAGVVPVALTAVKPNIGHLEAAAGIAGLIKVVLCLQHEAVPPVTHFSALNPHITLDGTRLFIPTTVHPWPAGASARFGGVSSFGFGGTNAHVVVEEAPRSPVATGGGGPFALTVSGHTSTARREAASQLADQLDGAEETDVGDVCFTAALRRTHHDERLVVVGTSRDDLAGRLRQFAAGETTAGVVTGRRHIGERHRVAFICSGQGPQWWAMGRQLLATSPVFRDVVEQCDGLLRRHVDWSLLDELGADEAASRLDQTEYAQPAIFALQVGLAAMWQTWGVVPDAVVGHSVGEVAAAHLAGALTLEDAVRVIALRGRFMQAATGTGTMASVELPADAVAPVLAPFCHQLSIAAINAPTATVISGDSGAMAEVTDTLRSMAAVRPLPVNYAFHSHQMEPHAAELAHALGDLVPQPHRLTFVSTVTGAAVDGTKLDAAYWEDNVRRPVRFADAVGAVAQWGGNVFVELAPHPVLGAAIMETLSAGGYDGIVVASLRRGRPDLETLFTAAGQLHCCGVGVDWAGVMPGRHRVADLPTYPWQHQRHWCDTTGRRRSRVSAPANPLQGHRVRSAAIDGYVFESELSPAQPAFLADHRIGDLTVVPATAFLELAAAAFAAATSRPARSISDVEILAPLAFDGDEPAIVQVHLQGTDPMRFSVASAAGDDWTVHATGRVGATPRNAPASTDLDAIRGRLHEATTAEAIYARLSGQGVVLGESFRAVEEVRVGAGEALARVVAPPSVRQECARFAFHPALLDACLHALAAVLDPSGRAHLPVAVAGVDVHTSPIPDELWAHVRIVEETTATVAADVAIVTAEGAPVADVSGLRLVRTDPESVARALGRTSRRDDVLYQLAWQPATVDVAGPIGPFVIVGDGGGVGPELTRRLEEGGVPAVLVPRIDGTDLAALVTSTGARDVVYLAALDTPALGTVPDPATAIRPVLAGAVATARATLGGPATRLWLVTRGAQPVEGPPTAPEQAPLWGLAASITAEHPELTCIGVDLDPDDGTDTAAILPSALGADDGETVVALRGGHRLVGRLTVLPSNHASGSAPTRLVASEPGVLDRLQLVPLTRRDPGPGEVEIRVHVTGLNFRDVLVALDLYPEPEAELGDECSGEVVRVGPGVERLRPGDRVIAMARGSFADYVTTAADLVIGVPDDLSFDDAATIPIPFLTAHLALDKLGGLAAGERVLIHAGAGGVGMAAVQLAQRAGAKIFATAGSPEKRDALRALGVRHVFDSRSLAFADDVLRATGGTGVDVVLNSLTGDFIPRSLDVLAPGGRFLEIGRRDIWDAQQVAAVRPDVAYHVIFLGDLSRGDPPAIQAMLAELLSAFATGVLHPLPCRAVPIERAVDAFRFMAQARHIGKLVVRHDVAGPDGVVRSDGTYLITGGTGGIGVHVARRLVDRGARHLALVARHDVDGDTAVVLESLRATGATITTFQADVTDRDSVAHVLAAVHEVMAPLRGIIHAAGVNDDAVLDSLTEERLGHVLGPKVTGAWHLYDLTRHLPLDLFVLVSSAASVLGGPAQANYAAANAFLDALGARRRAETGIGLTIGWGPWDGVGMTARLGPEDTARMARRGVRPLSPERAVEAFEMALASPAAHVLAVDLDPDALDARPLLAGQRRTAPPAPAANLVQQWAETVPGRRRAVIAAFVVETATKVLGLPAGSDIEPRQPFQELGLDSLMAVELRNAVGAALGQPQPATLLFDHPTPDSLVDHLLQLVGAPVEAAEMAPALDDAGDGEVAALADLTEAEAEALLLAELGPAEAAS
jgi:acyl transferase domain-containing protein